MATPILNKPIKTPTNAADYIAFIEDLARRNKGGGVMQAYDTSSNTPYVVPGAVAKDRQYDPVANMMFNPARPGANARFTYDGTSGDYVDNQTGERYTFEDLQRQITTPDYSQVPTPEGTNPPAQQPAPTQTPPQPSPDDFMDDFSTLDSVMSHAGTVMGAKASQQPQPNPFGISPAISKLFPKIEQNPYTEQALGKSYGKTPQGGQYNPTQARSNSPAGAGSIAYAKPEIPTLADIDPTLDARDKYLKSLEQNIAGYDQQEQNILDKSAHSDADKIRQRLEAVAGVKTASAAAEPTAPDTINIRQTLNQPEKGDIPSAGQGVTDLQSIFAPLAETTQNIIKPLSATNPFKKIGDASASINTALDSGGKALAKGVGAVTSKAGTVVNNAQKTAGNIASNAFRAIDNTKPVSASTSTSVNVGNKTSAPGGSSNTVKSPAPSGKAVYSPPKVTYAPISTYKAPPKVTPAPTPKPQPKASPAPNPVASVLNIFKKLFGR